MFSPVDEKQQLAEIEREILQYWRSIDAFNQSNKLSEGKPEYVFYDGPPFATGLPHYGHILAGTLKDVATRYAYQTGHHVPRVFGWDTHGLPVEHEIDKQYNITDRQQIENEIGIEEYCNRCKSIVMKYSSEWERIVERSGRWIDFKNSYKSMDVNFMESVWWIFKQLWNSEDVYRGLKVMPYSTACKTPLSNFEAGLDYREVSDPAVFVAFQVPGENYDFVAWTTTPWTLPSNLILAVNPKLTYCRVLDVASGKRYVLLKSRVAQLYPPKGAAKYTIEEEFPGTALVGKKYTPLFPYFAHWDEKGAFRVCDADYVTDDSGSGIVHCAPGFGEEDYKVCIRHGIIEADQPIVCPIDDNGCFTEEVSDYKGMYVKDADAQIIERLKKEGRLIRRDQIKHEYPFCWRSGTPLLYRAIPSWFVRIEKHRERLIENTLQTQWVPPTIRDGRFLEWLKGARDWAISRNRYWGTPLPIWVTEDYSDIIVVDSIKTLEELSGVTGINDLHRPTVDGIVINKDGKVYRRVPEVFDCWFESGSMPFSQFHIPFSGREWRQADFIAEGLDQTRGWFYTMTVLSTLLGHPSPFKNLIVNGLILAEDGKKMSKKLKNYPDPEEIMEKVGADSIRLYLVNSPSSHAEPLCFKRADVEQIIRSTMLPWMNTLKFWVEQVIRHGNQFKRNPELAYASENILDKWILSKTQKLIKFVHTEMKQYHLYTVLPELVKFISELNNWYVRLNRYRLKKGEDAQAGLSCLFEVLLALSSLMAPFAPFFSEFSYLRLKPALSEEEAMQSIHFKMLPQANEALIFPEIEQNVGYMQSAICIARLVRDRKKIPVRRPMKSLTIVCSEIVKAKILSLTHYITSEVNVLSVAFETDEKKFVKFTASPDCRALGRKFGKKLKDITNALTAMPYDQMESLYDKAIEARLHEMPAPEFTLEGETLNTDEVMLARTLVNPNPDLFDGGAFDQIVAFADITADEEIIQLNVAREIRSRIQMARKNLGCVPTDKVKIYFNTAVPSPNEITDILNSTKPMIVEALEFKIHQGQPQPEEKIFSGKSFQDKINEIEVTVTLIDLN